MRTLQKECVGSVDAHLSFDQVFTVKVPLADHRLQHVLLLLDLALGLRDLLLPLVDLTLSHLVVAHLLLNLRQADATRSASEGNRGRRGAPGSGNLPSG